MNIQKAFLTGLILAASAILLGAFPAAAEVRPSSDLLLPWFEVDLEGGAHTTLFALANSSAEPVDVLVSVQTNWGIPVLNLTLTLSGGQIGTVDLRDWLVLGRLPSGALGSLELAHVQAALSGRASPRDGLYYASPPAVPGRAVGSITFRAEGVPRPAMLWGDFILFDSQRGTALAEGLVSLDSTDCFRHGLRFLTGHQAEMASELWLWTRRRGEPSATSEPPESSRAGMTAEVFDEAGRRLATHSLDLPSVARISLVDLAGNEPFGRIDLSTGDDSFAGVVVRDEHGMAMLLPAVCLPAPAGPRLRLDIMVHGEEAPAPPGPSLPVGETIDWSYTVTNTGDVPLSGIFVSDRRGIGVDCPGEMLAPGEFMTCTGMSAAVACQQEITAQATAQTPAGKTVEASGSACYFGGTYGRASIDLETTIGGAGANGEDADVPPGPTLYEGPPSARLGPVTIFQVTNTGSLPLSSVTVSDDGGLQLYASCKDTLELGEVTTCHAFTPVARGLNSHVGQATAVTACGDVVRDQDPTYFFGERAKLARLEVKALPNGLEAYLPWAVTILAGQKFLWTYSVVNSGEVTLSLISVEHTGSSIEYLGCQKAFLAPRDSTVCYASERASPGQHQITVRATGRYYRDASWLSYTIVGSTDTVYYFGAAPAVDLEVTVKGEDADTAPGPEIPEGSPISWVYRVTNLGNISLILTNVVDGTEVLGCLLGLLKVGASISCSVMDTAVAGPHQSTASITGTPYEGIIHPSGVWTGPPVTDSDTTWYTGVPPSP